MIQLEQIKSYYPQPLRDNALFGKYLLKEYIQLMILNYLSSTRFIRKMVFIGGTCLRLAKGIDRFSENLDFDCKDLSEGEFMEMTNAIILFLKDAGLDVIVRDKENPNITAFRRNIYFPELLFDLGMSGHREERFMIKVESQDQGIAYDPVIETITGCGFFFRFPVPPIGILCSMKIAAMLSRAKGRDFYDLMFLLAQTQPDYPFLTKRCGIHHWQEFLQKAFEALKTVDLKKKQKDFEHLLFITTDSAKILWFEDYIRSITE